MGRVCFTNSCDMGLLNQRIGKFVISKDVIPKFFFRCLQTTAFRARVESRCEGSKVRHLYFRHFQGFPIPIFDKAEQENVAEQLDAFDASMIAVEQAVSTLTELRQGLIDKLTDKGCAS
jgi:restriction endonuclease S subunit